jgi:hypothetical protein
MIGHRSKLDAVRGSVICLDFFFFFFFFCLGVHDVM